MTRKQSRIYWCVDVKCNSICVASALRLEYRRKNEKSIGTHVRIRRNNLMEMCVSSFWIYGPNDTHTGGLIWEPKIIVERSSYYLWAVCVSRIRSSARWHHFNGLCWLGAEWKSKKWFSTSEMDERSYEKRGGVFSWGVYNKKNELLLATWRRDIVGAAGDSERSTASIKNQHDLVDDFNSKPWVFFLGQY